MFDKRPKLHILGEKFNALIVLELINKALNENNPLIADLKIRKFKNSNHGSLWVAPPENIEYNINQDDSDYRITWLLEYIDVNIDLVRQYGADDIILDIEYHLDIENISQKYIDCLSIDQMSKMVALGIKYEVTIWPNFIVVDPII